jgi:hypothetical protein
MTERVYGAPSEVKEFRVTGIEQRGWGFHW